jgi:hypothetical protein
MAATTIAAMVIPAFMVWTESGTKYVSPIAK